METIQTIVNVVCFYESFESEALFQCNELNILWQAKDAGLMSEEECEECEIGIIEGVGCAPESLPFESTLNSYELKRSITDKRLELLGGLIGISLKPLNYSLFVRDYFSGCEAVEIECYFSAIEKMEDFINANDFTEDFNEYLSNVVTPCDGYNPFYSMKDFEHKSAFKARMYVEFLNEKCFEDDFADSLFYEWLDWLNMLPYMV